MFTQNAYSSSQPYGSATSEPLAFYQGGPSGSSSSGNMGGGGYYGSSQQGSAAGSSRMDSGNQAYSSGGGGGGGALGNMASGRVGSMMAGEGRWWEAFGTGGFEGEPSLMQELGIQPAHILQKALTVLNPLSKVDQNIMDDADMAGPFVFCFAFAFVLLLSGKPQFSYIYGVGLLGTTAIYFLLNLMSDEGIDAYRTASVLGYCLLPMVGLGGIGIGVGIDHVVGYVLSVMSIVWCTYSASTIFVAVLRMNHQRLLVAYPVGLLYGCFALLSIFQAAK